MGTLSFSALCLKTKKELPDQWSELLFRLELLKRHEIHSGATEARLVTYINQIVVGQESWMSGDLNNIEVVKRQERIP